MSIIKLILISCFGENGVLVLKIYFGFVIDNFGLDQWDDHSPCHHLIGLIILSRGIEAIPAPKILKENVTVFTVSLFTQFLQRMPGNVFENLK